MRRIVILWDWDGVIGKTDAFNEYAFGSILRSLELPMKEGWYKRHFFGRKLEDAIKHYLAAEGLSEELLPQIATAKKGFDAEYEKAIEPYPDAVALIRRFEAEERLQVVVSGVRKGQINAGMRKFDLTNVFEVVVTAGDYKEGKPKPDSLLTALAKANSLWGDSYTVQDCMVIEDAPNGIVAAKAAGMFCIAVTHTHSREELAGADLIVDDLREIFSLEGE